VHSISSCLYLAVLQGRIGTSLTIQRTGTVQAVYSAALSTTVLDRPSSVARVFLSGASYLCSAALIGGMAAFGLQLAETVKAQGCSNPHLLALVAAQASPATQEDLEVFEDPPFEEGRLDELLVLKGKLVYKKGTGVKYMLEA